MENIEIKNPSPELVKLFSYKEWRQRIHLYDNIFSPGTRGEYEWEYCHLPKTLKNKSFIDVGSNDGMFSFLAEGKGAAEIKSVDIYVEENDTGWHMTGGWPINRIKDIKKIKKSHIDIQPCSIYELKSLGKKFDITFCGNVIAWLEDPLNALKQLASITKEKLIIREDISSLKGGPLLEYVNNEAMAGCFFNGNESFYRKYLLSMGFKNVSFTTIDEYEIFVKRARDHKKYTIAEGTKIFKNPFSESDFVISDKVIRETGSALVNKKYFFNNFGWVDIENVKQLPELIPTNPIKRELFARKFKKNMRRNCIIVAEK